MGPRTTAPPPSTWARELKQAGVEFTYSISETGMTSAATAFDDADVWIEIHDSANDSEVGLVPAEGDNPAAFFDYECGRIFVRVGAATANPDENEQVVNNRAAEIRSALEELSGPC